MNAREESGFTLIELLIAVVLLGAIMAAITSATIVAFRTIDSSRQTVTDSAGAQLLSSYLVTDVQSSDKVNPSAPDTCSAAGGGTIALELRWSDASQVAAGAASPAVTDVVYQTEPDGSGDFRLARYSYSVNSAGACSLTSQKTLVQNVSTTAGDTQAVCSPSCNNNANQVGLHVTAFSQQPKTGFYQKYQFDLSGTRRTT